MDSAESPKILKISGPKTLKNKFDDHRDDHHHDDDFDCDLKSTNQIKKKPLTKKIVEKK